MPRRASLLAVLAVCVACALPSRDNPHDTALAPHIVLQVPITQGDQSTFFVFDATQSTDPSGGKLTFHWELQDRTVDGASADDTDFELSTGTNGLLSQRLTIPVGTLGSDGV